MKQSLLILAIILATHLSAQTKYSKEIQAQIKQVENNLSGAFVVNGKRFNILKRMEELNVKGLSIAVVKDYKIIWAKGYGWANEKQKIPVTPNTLFEPGSISKSLNAVGIMKLVQDQKIDLNTDINSYLKTWQFPYDSVSKGKKITMAQLLSHSAGLNVHGFPGYDRKSKIPSLVEILDGKAPANTPAVRSQFEPGLRHEYSGGGTTISQLILTDVTHQSYDRFMYDNILKPMGMTNSFYSQPPSPEKMKNLATGYAADGTPVPNDFHVYPEQAAAGLWTTPTDLCKYIIETQLAYKGKSSKVLNQQMTRLRLEPVNDKAAALGVFIVDMTGNKYFAHDAANAGFCGSYLGRLENGDGVAIFLNSENGIIMSEILTSLTSVYDWKGSPKPRNVKDLRIPDSLAQKYTGLFVYEGRLAEITKKEDGLYFWAEGADHKMYFETNSDFINDGATVWKSFITDGAGNVTGYKRINNIGAELPGGSRVTNVETLQASPYDLNDYGWNLVVTKRFSEAVVYLNKARELEKNYFAIPGNLGHAYLFLNQFDKAIEMYKLSQNTPAGNKTEANKMIADDFKLLEKKGLDKALMEKAAKLLGL